MLNPASLHALATIAARADDLLRATPSGYAGAFDDANVRAAPLEPSTNPLAVVPPKDAYLIVQGPGGARRYTQDGELALRDGVVTSAGHAVLGFVPGARTLQPLHVDAVDEALGHVAGLRVEPDGQLTYARTAIDPATGTRSAERVSLGMLALARFPAGARPVREGPALSRAPHGTEPGVGRSGDADFGALTLHARDRGRFDVLTGIERLQEAYLSFEALSGAQRGRGNTDRTAIDLVK